MSVSSDLPMEEVNELKQRQRERRTTWMVAVSFFVVNALLILIVAPYVFNLVSVPVSVALIAFTAGGLIGMTVYLFLMLNSVFKENRQHQEDRRHPGSPSDIPASN